MTQFNGFRLLATLGMSFVLASCFSSSPTRSSGDGSTSTSMPAPPAPPSETNSQQSGTQGQSSTRGRTARNSSATAPDGGSMPVPQSSQGSTSGTRDSGRLPGQEGGTDGAADIRVATAERPGAGTNVPDAPVADEGRDSGAPSAQPDVGVSEALEAANAAVDAAAEAVDNADATIARARDAAADAQGGGETDSFDPWLTPGAGEQASDSTAGGGGQASTAKGEGRDSAAPGGGADETAGDQEPASTRGGRTAGNDNFDPFADYGEQAGGPGQPTGLPNPGSLQIADDAVAAARAALNRARRALIEAADAGEPGTGDSDADAVQLAAARAALDAAAEAVVAAAIAVMAVSDTVSPETDPGSDPNDQSGQDDEIATGIAMMVEVLQRDMTNAGEALEATADLLSAAGTLIAMIGNGDETQQNAEETEGTPGDRVASLEEQLDTSLTVFDDRMYAEGTGVVPVIGGDDGDLGGAQTATGGNTDPTLASDGMPNNTGSGRTAEKGSGDRPIRRPDGTWSDKRENAEGWKPETASGTKNEEFRFEDEAGGQDDDIVARQLREAATAETDPELREKLWEEYRVYKEGLEDGGD